MRSSDICWRKVGDVRRKTWFSLSGLGSGAVQARDSYWLNGVRVGWLGHIGAVKEVGWDVNAGGK